jgi:hypothetical protein
MFSTDTIFVRIFKSWLVESIDEKPADTEAPSAYVNLGTSP